MLPLAPAGTRSRSRADTFGLRLANPGETHARLGFPFVEAAGAVSRGELDTAFRLDKFDVVSALACAFDETLLLLVPLELAPLAFPRGGLIAR